jgi:signal transduction histidine kinase
VSQATGSSRVHVLLPAAVPLVLGLALSTLLVLDQRDRAQLHADAAVRASVASSVTQVDDAIGTQLTQAAAGAGGVAPATPSGVAPASLIEARDTGAPALDDSVEPTSIVVPVYRPGLPVATTAQRRVAITSYRVLPLVLGATLADLPPDGGGILVLGPHGTVAGRTGAPQAGARTFSIDLDLTGKPGWRVQGWLPSPGTPRGTWLWVVGILGLAGGTSAAVALMLQQRATESQRAAQMKRDQALVTGLAPIVQASLDLAQVVPAVSMQLADGLGLLGIGLSVSSETGERQLFTWGAAPDVRVAPRAPTPKLVESGRTLAVSLTRGGRVLGVLRIVAGEPLHEHSLQALSTAGELLGSTLANAEAFARQQVLVERMRSVDELKTIFLATASHELRTPVTAIVGFSSLLLDSWENMDLVEGRQFLERVMSNARGLETLIEQLLDFSRLDRGVHPVANAVLDLAETTGRILHDHPDLVSGHELRCELVPGSRLWGSASALERIVSNLVGNAAKYSPAGTTITVGVHAQDEQVSLVVDDEGAGVPEADRERVFSRFFRGGGDAVASTRGAGIGLAIVAEYSSAMSGSVKVTEAPSGGARFTVTFPAAREPADNVREGVQHVSLP